MKIFLIYKKNIFIYRKFDNLGAGAERARKKPNNVVDQKVL